MNTVQPRLSPQAREVLRAIERFGSITGTEAHTILKVRSLTARIFEIDLKTMVNIKRVWKQDSEGQRYMRYSLEPHELTFLKREHSHLLD